MASDLTPVVRTIEAGQGRQLEVLTAGPADGVPLVFHNGTPSGLVAFAPMVATAADRGLRTVMYGRPGYGASTAQRGRRVADAAADVATVLDDLGAGEFVTAGWSGGGPHALATAVLLAGRCRAAATIAGVAPYEADGLDWLAGMGEENIEEFAATVKGEAALTEFLHEQAAQLRGVTADQVAASLGDLVGDADKAVITGEFASYLAAAFTAALSSGIEGWRDDDFAFASDWGFPLGAPVPVAIWQGDQDRMVPFAHGQWLAGHVPGATAHLIPGAGHLSLIDQFEMIVDDLVSASGIR